MDFTVVYPKLEPKAGAGVIWRRTIWTLLLVGCIACGIVNLCLGGRPWFLYILGGSVVFWAVFLYRPLVEYSFIRKLSVILCAACAYLVLIDWMGKSVHWSKFVVPVVFFSMFVFLLGFFFARFKQQKNNLMPVYWIFLLSIASVITVACGAFSMTMTWPIIIIASLDGVMLILSFIFFRVPLAREFAKKFHLE